LWVYYEKKIIFSLLASAIFLIIVLLFFLFIWHQPKPTCEDDEALYFHWSKYNIKRYDCIPDPDGCHLLVKEGQLRSKECDEREDCFTPCNHLSGMLMTEVCAGCIPKDFKDYLK